MHSRGFKRRRARGDVPAAVRPVFIPHIQVSVCGLQFRQFLIGYDGAAAPSSHQKSGRAETVLLNVTFLHEILDQMKIL